MGKLSDAINNLFKDKPAQDTVVLSDRLSVKHDNNPNNQTVIKNEENVKAKNDCVSCRYISSAVLTGSSVYLLYNARFIPPKIQQSHRIRYRIACLSIGLGIGLLAVMQFAESGLYSKNHESWKSIWEDIKDPKSEICNILANIGIKPPDFFNSKGKNNGTSK